MVIFGNTWRVVFSFKNSASTKALKALPPVKVSKPTKESLSEISGNRASQFQNPSFGNTEPPSRVESEGTSSSFIVQCYTQKILKEKKYR
mmetsp:Transcript_58029/g.79082  ORF Transcript_58029/g.79082 Transcript_58029/m.79082 type:complete len:90 (+) Transcript_58029:192-461(+)